MSLNNKSIEELNQEEIAIGKRFAGYDGKRVFTNFLKGCEKIYTLIVENKHATKSAIIIVSELGQQEKRERKLVSHGFNGGINVGVTLNATTNPGVHRDTRVEYRYDEKSDHVIKIDPKSGLVGILVSGGKKVHVTILIQKEGTDLYFCPAMQETNLANRHKYIVEADDFAYTTGNLYQYIPDADGTVIFKVED